MSISVKLIAPFVAVAMLAILAFGYGFADFQRMDRGLEVLAAEVNVLNRLADELATAGDRQALSLLSYRYQPEPEYLLAVQASTRVIDELVDQFDRHLDEPVGQGLLDEYKQARDALVALQKQLIAARGNGDATAIEQVFRAWEQEAAHVNEIRGRLVSYINSYPEQTLRSLDAWRDRSLGVLSVFAVVFLAGTAGLLVLVRRIVILPLRRLTSTAEQIAQGALDLPLQSGGDDEIGRLAGAFERMKNHLVEARERAHVTLMSLGEAVVVTDAHGRIDSLNRAAAALSGWSLAEVRGRHLDEVFRLEAVGSGDDGHDERGKVLVTRAGRRLRVAHSAAPIMQRDGLAGGSVMVLRDVSEAHRLQTELAYQARHDPLTGLLNRREFERRLTRARRHVQEEGGEHALLYLDLDRFKVINDSCGHAAGEELLRQVTALLTDHLRLRDSIARLGGDEFGLLLEHCGLAKAMEIGNELRDAVQEFRFAWAGQTFSIGLSAGLVIVGPDSPPVDRLLGHADAACYAAKAAGRDRLVVSSGEGDEFADPHRDAQWAVRITDALVDERLRLRRQLIRPLAAAAEPGYEVLLYMCSGDGEVVPPGAFIPAAERYHLMTRIDSWVVERIFQWMGCELAAGREPGLHFINLSGQSVGDEEFWRFLRRRLTYHKIPPALVCFEITETVVVANLIKARRFIRAFRRMGCRFALDDFGSGASSYTYLKRLPVDFIKIDGGFIRGICTDAADYAMVESINRIGHALGKQTIAEYVENDAVLQRVREMEIDFVQGFSVALPVPLGTS